jgi:hypothetical protein
LQEEAEGPHQKLIIEKQNRREFLEIYPPIRRRPHLFEQKSADEGITDVVIAGGDGTISQVAGNLRHTNAIWVDILWQRQWSYGCGNQQRSGKALEIVFNGGAGYRFLSHHQQFSCMLSGIGFDAKVAHEFARVPLAVVFDLHQSVGKEFFSTRPYPSF